MGTLQLHSAFSSGTALLLFLFSGGSCPGLDGVRGWTLFLALAFGWIEHGKGHFGCVGMLEDGMDSQMQARLDGQILLEKLLSLHHYVTKVTLLNT